MTMDALVIIGTVGILLDLLLHVLQMFPECFPSTVRTTSLITIWACGLGALSLIPQWNLPLAVYSAAAIALAFVALVSGKGRTQP